MTLDELKIRRDGHLGYGPREWSAEYWNERRQPKPGTMLWHIERDDTGQPIRMWWLGRVPAAASEQYS